MEKSGAFVINKRVNGTLAVSWAFGDFIFKKQKSQEIFQKDLLRDAVLSKPEVF